MLTQEEIEQFREIIREENTPIKKEIKSIKKNISYIKKTVDIVVRQTDESDVDLQHRMKRVEKVLDLPPFEH